MEELLIKAKNEIIRLRRDNDFLNAQMSVVEVFAAAFGLKRNSQGMCIDIVWEIEKELEKISK